MKHIYKYAVLAATMFSLSNVHADDAAVKAALKKAMPTVTIDSITPTGISGLQEVVIQGGIFYVSTDGKYLLQGHLIDIEAKKDITEEKLAVSRVKSIKDVGEENMIIFKPETSKYKVSIFTDIDCGYCRKLHSEMDQYLAEGITVQYLFFPRAGKGSESYDKAVSVWCADDKNKALTDAKSGTNPDKKTCDNPVDAHMALGEAFDARGTPMIITEKGNVLPGYVPAKQLAQALAKE
ncbi:MAG: thioredoxin fold domain-containing protein [Methylococcaceae bacterium]|nr:thioredoxin fold domain-containing protein [Methylococcaceae bacterium]